LAVGTMLLTWWLRARALQENHTSAVQAPKSTGGCNDFPSMHLAVCGLPESADPGCRRLTVTIPICDAK